MVDEADVGVLDVLAGNLPGNDRRGTKRNIDTMPGSPRPSKRKVGPIPRDFVLKRPMSPQQSPSHSIQSSDDSLSEDDNFECEQDNLVINEDPMDIPELIISNGGKYFIPFDGLKSDKTNHNPLTTAHAFSMVPNKSNQWIYFKHDLSCNPLCTIKSIKGH